MTHKQRSKLLGAFAALGIVAAACGGGGSTSTTQAQQPTTTVEQRTASSAPASRAAGTETGASTLRAGLTHLLTEHVYLAGITTGTALQGQDFKPAADALDKNSVALSEAVGSVYGDGAGKQFLELWRKHIGFFVDFTMGQAAKDQAKIDKAKADLDGYRNDIGAFLSSANPNLTKQAVADTLKPHVDSVFAAIEAQAQKSPQAFDKLKTAAGHMPHTAATLSGAIAKQFPEKF